MAKEDSEVSRLRYRPSSGTAPARATALGRGTHGVPDVRRMVESQFHIAFPHRIWVAGQVGRPAVEDDGALRFTLHATTEEEEFALPCVVPSSGVASLRELLERGQDADLEDVVRHGRLARAGGLLRYDVARGSVAFLVSDLDTTPTALGLADEREQLLQQVVASGLAERQRILRPLTAPRHVTLVGDARDQALARVEHQLAGSGFDLRLRVLPVGLDVPEAPRRLVHALRLAGGDSDLVLLVRDEGRPLRLSTYDALDAARAVADCPVPVVTGLGGRGTYTACDQVAFAALPTAEAAAGWLLGRLSEAQRALHVLREEVEREVQAAGERARAELAQARAEVAAAAEEAEARAEAARSRRQWLLYGGVALLALLVVAAAWLADEPLLLLGLLVPAAVLVGERVWSNRARTMGSRGMGQREDDFAQVLQRLRGVRDDLGGTSSPEKVAGLRDLGARLVEEGERLLRRHLDRREPIDGPVTGSLPAGDVATVVQAEGVRVQPGRDSLAGSEAPLVPPAAAPEADVTVVQPSPGAATPVAVPEAATTQVATPRVATPQTPPTQVDDRRGQVGGDEPMQAAPSQTEVTQVQPAAAQPPAGPSTAAEPPTVRLGKGKRAGASVDSGEAATEAATQALPTPRKRRPPAG